MKINSELFERIAGEFIQNKVIIALILSAGTLFSTYETFNFNLNNYVDTSTAQSLKLFTTIYVSLPWLIIIFTLLFIIPAVFYSKLSWPWHAKNDSEFNLSNPQTNSFSQPLNYKYTALLICFALFISTPWILYSSNFGLPNVQAIFQKYLNDFLIRLGFIIATITAIYYEYQVNKDNDFLKRHSQPSNSKEAPSNSTLYSKFTRRLLRGVFIFISLSLTIFVYTIDNAEKNQQEFINDIYQSGEKYSDTLSSQKESTLNNIDTIEKVLFLLNAIEDETQKSIAINYNETYIKPLKEVQIFRISNMEPIEKEYISGYRERLYTFLSNLYVDSTSFISSAPKQLDNLNSAVLLYDQKKLRNSFGELKTTLKQIKLLNSKIKTYYHLIRDDSLTIHENIKAKLYFGEYLNSFSGVTKNIIKNANHEKEVQINQFLTNISQGITKTYIYFLWAIFIFWYFHLVRFDLSRVSEDNSIDLFNSAIIFLIVFIIGLMLLQKQKYSPQKVELDNPFLASSKPKIESKESDKTIGVDTIMGYIEVNHNIELPEFISESPNQESLIKEIINGIRKKPTLNAED